jgi:hypothetical protein
MSPSESPDELLVVAAILGNLESVLRDSCLRYRPAVVRLARTNRRRRSRRRRRARLATARFQRRCQVSEEPRQVGCMVVEPSRVIELCVQ